MHNDNDLQSLRRLAASLLVVSTLLLLSAGNSFAKDAVREAEEGIVNTEESSRMAPFKLKTLDGKTFDSKQQLNGRVSIVVFWRVGQDRSLKLLSDLVELRAAFPEDELNIVTILSGKTDPPEAQQIVNELDLRFPVLLEPERNVYAAFGIIVSPTSWFIDANGTMQLTYPGRRRDFLTTAKAHVEFLLGRISEEEHASRIEKKAAPRSSGTVGAPIRYRLAKRHLNKGEREAAQEQFLLAWEEKPPFAEAGVDLGILLLEDAKPTEALQVLKEAAELLPDDPRAQGAMGLALIRSGEAKEGEILLRAALANGLNEPLFFYEVGRLSELQGARDEALNFYKTGLKLSIDTKP